MDRLRFARNFQVATALWFFVLAPLVTVLTAAEASAANDGVIAFVGNQSGSFQLYTMNADGTRMTRITNLPQTPLEAFYPDFSPDGRQIAFCFGTVNGMGNLTTEIYVINADGSGHLKQLTHDDLFDCFPRWSPDGRTIVFGRQSPISLQVVVATMRADGSDKRELTTPLWGIGRSGFTPDGEHLVWDTQQAGFVSVIWIMNRDGDYHTRLTVARLKAGNSAPSPDGRHIAFESNSGTPTALPNLIFRMNLDGTGIKPLTRLAGNSHDVAPNYSPDGRKIVFASDRMSSDGGLDIFTMNADGSHLTRIATGITIGGCADKGCVTPAWGRKP